MAENAAYCVYFWPIVLLRGIIGYWHHDVVLSSVCLSVCYAVHCGSQGRCTGLKAVPVCSYSYIAARQVPIGPFRHFCYRMYHLATKTSRSKREREFLETQKTTRAPLYSALLTVFRTWEDRHRGLCSSRLSGLRLGAYRAFINSIQKNRIAWNSYSVLTVHRPKLVNRNRFDSSPVVYEVL